MFAHLHTSYRNRNGFGDSLTVEQPRPRQPRQPRILTHNLDKSEQNDFLLYWDKIYLKHTWALWIWEGRGGP